MSVLGRHRAVGNVVVMEGSGRWGQWQEKTIFFSPGVGSRTCLFLFFLLLFILFFLPHWFIQFCWLFFPSIVK